MRDSVSREGFTRIGDAYIIYLTRIHIGYLPRLSGDVTVTHNGASVMAHHLGGGPLTSVRLLDYWVTIQVVEEE
jgi:hypothetical protein